MIQVHPKRSPPYRLELYTLQHARKHPNSLIHTIILVLVRVVHEGERPRHPLGRPLGLPGLRRRCGRDTHVDADVDFAFWDR